MRLIKIEEPKILHSYINGNTTVTIYDDGTKVRETEDDDFLPVFPENIEPHITSMRPRRWVSITLSSEKSAINVALFVLIEQN